MTTVRPPDPQTPGSVRICTDLYGSVTIGTELVDKNCFDSYSLVNSNLNDQIFAPGGEDDHD